MALMPQLTNADKEHLARHPTENAEAYQAYLIGLSFWNRRALPKAIPYLEQAIAQDPNFALAHAILADCYYLNAMQRTFPLKPRESAERAEKLAVRALELDETVAEAHAVMAGLKVARKDYLQAETEYKRALELNPNVATIHVRYGYFLFNNLQLEGALREMRRAQELDPVSATTNGALGYMLIMSRNYDEALKFARRADELDPTLPAVMVILGDAYIQKGMIEEALAVFRRLETYNRTTGQQFITYALSKSPRRADAQKTLPDLLALAGEGRISPYTLAMIYGALGEKDEAFAWLKKADSTPQTRALLRFDPDLDSLRSDERFANVAAQYERVISSASAHQPVAGR
jgi:Tfp pilus assembly protein PilF